MLTPEQIARLADGSVQAFAEINAQLRQDAERAIVNLDPKYLDDPNRRKLLAIVEQDVTGGVTTALVTDEARYAAMRNAGLLAPLVPLAESAALSDALTFGVSQAQNLANLTATRARFAVQEQLYAELDRATLAIASNAVPKQKAIADAVKALATTDTVVTFPTAAGVRQMNLYTAVRTAVQTTTSRWAMRGVDTRLKELGFEYVEVSAHGDARPDHAVWQGQVYQYPDELQEMTGYEVSDDGLGSRNCRHFFTGYIPGFNEPAFDDVEYDPALYEETQNLRRAEAKIRDYKTRKSVTEAALNADPTNEYLRKNLDQDKMLVSRWQGKAREVTSRSGLRRQYDRERGL